MHRVRTGFSSQNLPTFYHYSETSEIRPPLGLEQSGLNCEVALILKLVGYKIRIGNKRQTIVQKYPSLFICFIHYNTCIMIFCTARHSSSIFFSSHTHFHAFLASASLKLSPRFGIATRYMYFDRDFASSWP